jgi:hypothetical protein
VPPSREIEQRHIEMTSIFPGCSHQQSALFIQNERREPSSGAKAARDLPTAEIPDIYRAFRRRVRHDNVHSIAQKCDVYRARLAPNTNASNRPPTLGLRGRTGSQS